MMALPLLETTRANYGIPEPIRTKALTCLDHPRLSILKSFESRYGTK